jgi:hypothetical protein
MATELPNIKARAKVIGQWSKEYAKVVYNDQTVPKGQQEQLEYISVVANENNAL